VTLFDVDPFQPGVPVYRCIRLDHPKVPVIDTGLFFLARACKNQGLKVAGRLLSSERYGVLTVKAVESAVDGLVDAFHLFDDARVAAAVEQRERFEAGQRPEEWETDEAPTAPPDPACSAPVKVSLYLWTHPGDAQGWRRPPITQQVAA
jgi:hypothetical protein